MAAGGDDEILLPGRAHAIGHGGGVATGGEWGFPHFFAGVDVKGTEEAMGGARDENNSAGGDDGPAEADGASRYLQRMRATKILHRAKGHLPDDFSLRTVRAGEQAPAGTAAAPILGAVTTSPGNS